MEFYEEKDRSTQAKVSCFRSIPDDYRSYAEAEPTRWLELAFHSDFQAREGVAEFSSDETILEQLLAREGDPWVLYALSKNEALSSDSRQVALEKLQALL